MWAIVPILSYPPATLPATFLLLFMIIIGWQECQNATALTLSTSAALMIEELRLILLLL